MLFRVDYLIDCYTYMSQKGDYEVYVSIKGEKSLRAA